MDPFSIVDTTSVMHFEKILPEPYVIHGNGCPTTCSNELGLIDYCCLLHVTLVAAESVHTRTFGFTDSVQQQFSGSGDMALGMYSMHSEMDSVQQQPVGGCMKP